MQKTSFKEGNVTLESAGEYESQGWYLTITDEPTGVRQIYAIELEEIERIADVCIEMLIQHAKPPKGIKKAIAK